MSERKTIAQAMQIAYNLNPRVDSIEAFDQSVVTFFSDAGYDFNDDYDEDLLKQIFDTETYARTEGVYAKLNYANTYTGINSFNDTVRILKPIETTDTNKFFKIGQTAYHLPTAIGNGPQVLVSVANLSETSAYLQQFATNQAENYASTYSNTLRDQIVNGGITAYKAERDAGGNVISSTYAKLRSANSFYAANYFYGIVSFYEDVTFSDVVAFAKNKAFQSISSYGNPLYFSFPNKIGNITEYTLATEEYVATITNAYDNGTRSVGYAIKAAQDYNGDAIHTTYVKKSQIYDGVDQTYTDRPLSANQGHYLYGLITAIQELLGSDDTSLDQLQEIVDYIKDNRDLIEVITTTKISYSDIVDNLTSNLSNKPLSAAQGYVLKGLVDALQSGKVGIVDIIDALNSTATNRPLSANQGRVLKGLIDALDAKIDEKTTNIPYSALSDETKNLINAKSAFMLTYKERTSAKYPSVTLPYYELIYTDGITVTTEESDKYPGVYLPTISINY